MTFKKTKVAETLCINILMMMKIKKKMFFSLDIITD